MHTGTHLRECRERRGIPLSQIAVSRDELVRRVGDPEAFAYTLNGVPGRPLGEAGKPVSVHITESNYQTFLAGSTPTARRGMSASVG